MGATGKPGGLHVPTADFGARAAVSDVVVIGQVDVEHQLALDRLERGRRHAEMILRGHVEHRPNVDLVRLLFDLQREEEDTHST